MKTGRLIPRLVAISIIIICMLIVNVKAEDTRKNKFSANPFQQALKEIGDKFNVMIIADPSLTGPVVNNIQGDSAEAALKTLLEPLGYSYTKVENYYLVSGPESPLTILAENDSTLIPVGFLDSQTRDKLSEFKQYFTYDESLGVAYVKAPSSQLNKILAKLWEISKTSGQLSVAYSIQIIDLGSSSDLDFLFSAKYDSSLPDNKRIILTPDQWSIDSPTQTIIQQKADSFLDSVARQPWLITLPGKTVQLTSSIRSIDSDLDVNRFFTIGITPVKVDESSGKVISDIHIERNMTTSQSNSSGNNTEQVSEPVNKVTTIVRTTPGKREILAVVRQIKESQTRLMGGLGQERFHEHRDFIVLISATPVNIQSTLATSAGLIPIASLGGFDRLMDEEEPEIKPILELGIAGIENENTVNGWFDFKSPIGSKSNVTLDYRNNDLYSAGFSFDLDSDHETSLELLAGKGVGPYAQKAVMLGLGDVTRPTPYLSLFAKYYPLSYLLDSKESSYDKVWLAGTRLGNQKFGVSLSALGDPDFEGWHLKMDASIKKRTWLMELDTTQQNPTLYLGVGFHF